MMAPTRKISGLSAAHSGSRSGRVLPCRTNSSRWAALMANSPSKMTAPEFRPRRARAPEIRHHVRAFGHQRGQALAGIVEAVNRRIGQRRRFQRLTDLSQYVLVDGGD